MSDQHGSEAAALKTLCVIRQIVARCRTSVDSLAIRTQQGLNSPERVVKALKDISEMLAYCEGEFEALGLKEPLSQSAELQSERANKDPFNKPRPSDA